MSVPEEELRKLKEESNVDSLRQELEKERSRCGELEQKINDMLRSRCLIDIAWCDEQAVPVVLDLH